MIWCYADLRKDSAFRLTVGALVASLLLAITAAATSFVLRRASGVTGEYRDPEVPKCKNDR
jgi:hypothetical protein